MDANPADGPSDRRLAKVLSALGRSFSAGESGGDLGEPLVVRHGPWPELLDRSDIVQVQQAAVGSKICRRGGVDELTRVVGAHLEEHLEVKLPLVGPAQASIEIVESIKPKQGMHADDGSVSKDVGKLFVGLRGHFLVGEGEVVLGRAKRGDVFLFTTA